MGFQKGNKFGKHGRQNPPGGRPTKEQAKVKRLTAEAVKEWIEDHGQELAELYITKAKKDNRVLMHAIDKLVPDAKKAIEIDMNIGLADAGFARANQRAREAAEKRKKQ